MEFFIWGHPNILSLHKTTLEFTKDKEVTLKGDCIVGVKANYKLKEVKEFIKDRDSVVIEFYFGSECLDSLTFQPNPKFNDEHEIVIRKSEFISKRTLGIKSSKSSYELHRSLIQILKDPKAKVKVLMR